MIITRKVYDAPHIILNAWMHDDGDEVEKTTHSAYIIIAS